MRQRATKVVDNGAPITARAKAVKVGDVATVDVLVGRDHGETGFRRVDVDVRPLADRGARVEIKVPTSLARPLVQLVAALNAGKRL